MRPSERKRVESGVCRRLNCGDPLFTRLLCYRHSEEARVYMRQRRDALLDKGKCIDCGEAKILTKHRCASCVQRNKELEQLKKHIDWG